VLNTHATGATLAGVFCVAVDVGHEFAPDAIMVISIGVTIRRTIRRIRCA
jgi:hypothetical protein